MTSSTQPRIHPVTGAGSPRTVYIVRWRAAARACLGVAWTGLALAVALGTHHPTWLLAIYAVVYAAGLVFCIRLARTAVIAEDATLTIRNVFRTYRIPWGEVGTMEWRLYQGWGPKSVNGGRWTDVLVIHTAAGARIKAFGLEQSSRAHRRHESYGERARAELQARRDEAHGHGTAPQRSGRSG